MKICYIDTETTGVDSKLDGIIQIAAIMEINGEVVGEFESRVRPFDGCRISEEALAVSGTNPKDLDGFPQPREVHKAFVGWLSGYIDKFSRDDKAFFAGYNSGFDVNFVREFFTRCGDNYFGSWFWSGSLDAMVMALYRLRESRHMMRDFKLGTVANHVLGADRVAEIIASEGLHNALADIRLTRELMKGIAQ